MAKSARSGPSQYGDAPFHPAPSLSRGTADDPPPPRPSLPAATTPLEGQLPSGGRNRTILIADDDDGLRVGYARLLEELGYTVLQAANGGEAILLVREHRPDVIVMDVAMPVLDGLEAAQSLKRFRETADIPIVGVTGTTVATDRERMRAVCHTLLLKPCEPAALLRAIAEAGSSGPEIRVA